MPHTTFLRSLFVVAAIAVCAVGQVTTATVEVGGPGANGCQGQGGAPLLTGGVPASATVDFTYDSSTGVLQIDFANTSAVTVGVENPLATQVYFNLPHLAISQIQLVSQTASGGATPNFMFVSDVDIRDGSNPIGVNCYGDFGACLSVQGSQGGIANPAADTLSGPAGSQVIGPATFMFQVTEVPNANINAAAFANSYSQNGMPANMAVKFQGGGPGGGESGVIGDTVRCDPSGWLIGEPRIGQTVTFVWSGFTGCPGCIVASMDPGPTQVGNTLYEIGTPAYVVTEGTVPPNQIMTMTFTIPNDPSWVGDTWYFLVILFQSGMEGEQSDQFQVTILP